jgi:molybdopterin-binding protein
MGQSICGIAPCEIPKGDADGELAICNRSGNILQTREFRMSKLNGNIPIRGTGSGRELAETGIQFTDTMTISARNQLSGRVEEIILGQIMAHVTVRVGDNLIESVITRRSVDALQLKVGDEVKAVVKSTEVMLQKD